MKALFKPLGLAAAVAAVTAGYTGVAQAQIANNALGDTAIIPYYTAEDGFITGVHIINTSDLTQVVKLRLRRGSDSMDALDFNIILSPFDEWTGFIDDEDGQIVMATDDNSCTAPLRADGRFPMPTGSLSSYEEGAEEGYIEVIGMASADATQPISIAAEHTADGVPLNCGLVESNFFRNATTAPVAFNPAGAKGILSSSESAQTCNDAILSALLGGAPTTCQIVGATVQQNVYAETGNVLKVSFFHRDADSGLEFGNNAVHLENFSADAMMSNQETIVAGQVDAYGYLYPDLDGGSPADTARGLYDAVVRPALGAAAIVNDWSVASARNVSTDWVVTMPGQYTMLDLVRYTTALVPGSGVQCLSATLAAAANPVQPTCDARDLPVNLAIALYDREEQTPSDPEGGLVISPSTSITSTDSLPYEVNVIQWNDGTNPPVLPSQYAKSYNVASFGAENGWASLSVTSSTAKAPQAVYNWALSAPGAPVFDPVVSLAVPIVGFVAWERSFPEDPSANYGRIVENSYVAP
jgi:hypothetical protein